MFLNQILHYNFNNQLNFQQLYNFKLQSIYKCLKNSEQKHINYNLNLVYSINKILFQIQQELLNMNYLLNINQHHINHKYFDQDIKYNQKHQQDQEYMIMNFQKDRMKYYIKYIHLILNYKFYNYHQYFLFQYKSIQQYLNNIKIHIQYILKYYLMVIFIYHILNNFFLLELENNMNQFHQQKCQHNILQNIIYNLKINL